MPLMMSYRYYAHMFSKFDNASSMSVVDYDDEENTTIVKPIPIMNFTNMYDIFTASFGTG